MGTQEQFDNTMDGLPTSLPSANTMDGLPTSLPSANTMDGLPTSLPSATSNPKKESSSLYTLLNSIPENQRRNIYLVGGASLLGATGYSLYKLGKLQDVIPHERLYVTSAIVGGALLGVQGIGMWSEPSESQKNIGKVGGVALVGGIGYALSRSLFKQNVNKSLLYAGISVAAIFGLGMYLKSNSNNQLGKK